MFVFFTVMTTSTIEKADGLKALDVSIAKIKETILSLGGHFAIQMAVSLKTKDLWKTYFS